MKILGVVVLYYPDEKVHSNILSYLKWLDGLIIWENTPRKDSQSTPLASANNVYLMGVGDNMGIGYALNEAISFAQKNAYTHLLTMDQDSSFGESTFKKYKKIVSQTNCNEIACFSVVYDNMIEINSKEVFEDIDFAITSGSIYPISIFNDLGLFRADYFIDSVDTEFCLRAKISNKRIVRLPSIYMNHKIGYMTYYSFLWGKLGTPNYSAIRTYYMIRNLILLSKEYNPIPSEIKSSIKYLLFNRLLRIILVEKDKKMKIKLIFKGLLDGLNRRTGKLK